MGNQVRRLTLRTGKIGDLFILYEVLAYDAYRISPTLVAPDKIKTIIDCGALHPGAPGWNTLCGFP
jgi:hypothetical protein